MPLICKLVAWIYCCGILPLEAATLRLSRAEEFPQQWFDTAELWTGRPDVEPDSKQIKLVEVGDSWLAEVPIQTSLHIVCWGHSFGWKETPTFNLLERFEKDNEDRSVVIKERGSKREILITTDLKLRTFFRRTTAIPIKFIRIGESSVHSVFQFRWATLEPTEGGGYKVSLPLEAGNYVAVIPTENATQPMVRVFGRITLDQPLFATPFSVGSESKVKVYLPASK
jgi:hypothetical protein